MADGPAETRREGLGESDVEAKVVALPSSTTSSTSSSSSLSSATYAGSSASSSAPLPTALPEVEARFESYWASTCQTGRNFTGSLRARAEFNNPYILDRVVASFGIDEHGSNFPRVAAGGGARRRAFHPSEYEAEDFYQILQIQQARGEGERAARLDPARNTPGLSPPSLARWLGRERQTQEQQMRRQAEEERRADAELQQLRLTQRASKCAELGADEDGGASSSSSVMLAADGSGSAMAAAIAEARARAAALGMAAAASAVSTAPVPPGAAYVGESGEAIGSGAGEREGAAEEGSAPKRRRRWD